ncbi:MAG: nucleotidyltransferase family protein [Acidobacteria bacterium]|nr:nucleotidyltransferase family protein [Acidobacteriota bacterium]
MTLDELRETKRDQILRLAAGYGARNVRVFGSMARGDNSPASDIDFLVDLDPDRSLMDLGGLLMELQEMLQTQVDVATEGMLRAKARERALLDAVLL